MKTVTISTNLATDLLNMAVESKKFNIVKELADLLSKPPTSKTITPNYTPTTKKSGIDVSTPEEQEAIRKKKREYMAKLRDKKKKTTPSEIE